ncbi:hypothetical protein BC830DRAFT_426533 [Chytriomyces sp. MP71]|nr:hypothetical protein BC830DRAFT_426533 [Chytriomyces sp. MP71]
MFLRFIFVSAACLSFSNARPVRRDNTACATPWTQTSYLPFRTVSYDGSNWQNLLFITADDGAPGTIKDGKWSLLGACTGAPAPVEACAAAWSDGVYAPFSLVSMGSVNWQNAVPVTADDGAPGMAVDGKWVRVGECVDSTGSPETRSGLKYADDSRVSSSAKDVVHGVAASQDTGTVHKQKKVKGHKSKHHSKGKILHAGPGSNKTESGHKTGAQKNETHSHYHANVTGHIQYKWKQDNATHPLGHGPEDSADHHTNGTAHVQYNWKQKNMTQAAHNGEGQHP